MADIQFVDGLIVKAPPQSAPEYVRAKLSIKRAELIVWLQARDGEWINADIKVSSAGKWYAAVDNWKPESRRARGGGPVRPAPNPASDFHDDDIPF